MTNQTLSQQTTIIANLGQWLQQNVDGVLQEPKINKICQDWDITRKVFDRIFDNYIAKGKKVNYHSIRVVDTVTGEAIKQANKHYETIWEIIGQLLQTRSKEELGELFKQLIKELK